MKLSGRPCHRRRGKASPSDLVRQGQILVALSRGASQRQANEAVGLTSGAHWAAGNVRKSIRRKLADGVSPQAIAAHYAIRNPDSNVLGYIASLAGPKPPQRLGSKPPGC